MELARQGMAQVIIARREDRLRELAGRIAELGGRVETVSGDLSDAAVRQRVIEAARASLGGLDLLVNNAGVGSMGLFEDSSPEYLRRVMEVNFFSLVEMTRLALPLLRAGVRPMLVNVSSILGHRGVPHSSEYCASKFAVQGFSESLRAELAPHGIDVLVVSPGTTETEFFESVIRRTGEPAWPQHGRGVRRLRGAADRPRGPERASRDHPLSLGQSPLLAQPSVTVPHGLRNGPLRRQGRAKAGRAWDVSPMSGRRGRARPPLPMQSGECLAP